MQSKQKMPYLSNDTTDIQDVYASYSFDPITKSNKIKKRVYTVRDTGQSYEMFTYDKHFLCDKGEPISIRQCRSVVFSYPEHKLLSFSPPKSITSEEFYKPFLISNAEGCQNTNNDYTTDIFSNEIVEGTLVHLFYDSRNQSWEMATKNAVGGQYKLFHNTGKYDQTIYNKFTAGPTVYRMFLDALRAPPSTKLNQIPIIQNLSTQYSYSFVLQHPENPIILPIEFPALYLVAVYDVFGPFHNDLRVVAIPPTIFQHWSNFVNTPILFPKMVDLVDLTKMVDLTEKSLSIGQNKSSVGSIGSVGTMIINTRTGERCAIRNPEYMNAFSGRDINKCHQYQFLCLLRINKIKEYLQYFSKQKAVFSKFDEQYQQFVKNVHLAYMEKYVYEKPNLPQICHTYLPIIRRLHKEIYLPSLAQSNHNAQNKIKITQTVVRDFIKKMEPREQQLYVGGY